MCVRGTKNVICWPPGKVLCDCINYRFWESKGLKWLLLIFSGFDSTVRVWTIPETVLQHTFLFQKPNNVCGKDLEGTLISRLAWSSNGKYIAAAMEDTLNIWYLPGRRAFVPLPRCCEVFTQL